MYQYVIQLTLAALLYYSYKTVITDDFQDNFNKYHQILYQLKSSQNIEEQQQCNMEIEKLRQKLKQDFLAMYSQNKLTNIQKEQLRSILSDKDKMLEKIAITFLNEIDKNLDNKLYAQYLKKNQNEYLKDLIKQEKYDKLTVKIIDALVENDFYTIFKNTQLISKNHDSL